MFDSMFIKVLEGGSVLLSYLGICKVSSTLGEFTSSIR